MYAESDRQIFQYYNGEKQVFGDPLALYKQVLIATGGKPDELDARVRRDLGTATTEQIADSAIAHQQLCDLVRRVFKMKPYIEETNAGAMDEHCIMAWKDLARCLNEKKNPAVSLPTESAPTDGPQESPTPTTST